MLEQLFIALLGSSAAAGLLILILLALSPVLDRFYASKWKYCAWLIISISLIIPLRLPFPTPALLVVLPGITLGAGDHASLSGIPQPRESGTDIHEFSSAAPGQNLPPEEEVPSALPSETGERAGISLTEAFSWLWLGGAVVFLLHRTAGILAFRRRVLRWSRPVKTARVTELVRTVCAQMQIGRNVPVLVNSKISSPMMTGIFRPVLLLPSEDYPERELTFILQHEFIHYRRHDLVYKLLLLLANALHWFNPLVFLMVREAENDLELSCDDLVLKTRPAEDRRAYSEAILAAVRTQRRKHTALTTYFNGGTKMMKLRFRNILDTRTKHGGGLVTAAILAGVLTLSGLFGFTTAQAGTETDIRDIELEVKDCNAAVKFSGDGTLQYMIDEDIHKLTSVTDGTTLRLTLESTGKENKTGKDMAVLYLPDTAYGKITVNCDSAGLSLPSLDGDFSIKCSSSAISLNLSEDFDRSVDFTAADSSGSLNLDPGSDNYTFTMNAESSAVSLPDEFPEYAFNRSAYKYTKGNGASKINLTLEGSAFSVSLRENRQADAGDGDGLHDLIPLLDGGEELKFGPFKLEKGDVWTPQLTWEGESEGGVYIAAQPASRGESFRAGQYQQRGESGEDFSSMDIRSGGEYLIFVGNRGETPISSVQVDVAFHRAAE